MYVKNMLKMTSLLNLIKLLVNIILCFINKDDQQLIIVGVC